jgi:hypothetical protein
MLVPEDMMGFSCRIQAEALTAIGKGDDPSTVPFLR